MSWHREEKPRRSLTHGRVDTAAEDVRGYADSPTGLAGADVTTNVPSYRKAFGGYRANIWNSRSDVNGTELPVNVSLSHIDTGDVLLVITGAGDVANQKNPVRDAALITAIVEYCEVAIIGRTF